MSEPDNLIRRRSQLSPAGRALLEKWTRGKSTESPPARLISPRSTRGPTALSFGQQRLWFLDQLVPGNTAYNTTAAFLLRGRLRVAVLQQSLDEIIRRHEALRTTFTAPDGLEELPMQVVSPALCVPLPIVDLGTFSRDQLEATVRGLATREALQPFDLAEGPLVRTTLVRLDEREHMLLLSMHHIISDGWSVGVFIRELTTLYSAFSEGKPSPLPELPIQYADYALWQREQLQDKLLESHLTYWKRQLSGMPTVLELPTDRPRPLMQSFAGARQVFKLSQALSEGLKALSRQEGVTLFMTLLAAFQTLLFRYTGQDDIAVGTPIANRDRPETEGLIGFFANTLVLRGDLSGNPTFQELLRRVRETALVAYEHQELPFEQLVGTLDLERDLSRNPLFQVMLALQNTPLETHGLPDLVLQVMEVESATAKFDLWLSIAEGPQGLLGILEYNTGLFDATTITRMLGHFERLLEAVVEAPQQRISDLPYLTEVEEQQLLVTWNATRSDYPHNLRIHEVFEEQAKRTPDTIAVVFEEMQISYRQLNQRANQVAHYLRTLGVEAETLVGICMERSLELVVGLLGILKSGGAYVPLDPTYPVERLGFMLEDARVPVILTQARLRAQLPAAEVICLDGDWERIEQQMSEDPERRAGMDNVAYVIYTSGSTGKPKGVMNTHRGILNRLQWMQETYQLGVTDRVMQKTPISFDVSVWEFFWPLLTGARLVLARPGGHRESAYLVELIREQEVTTLHFVPSMLRAFLEERELQECRSLRLVICSGEALPFDLQARFFARLDVELQNLYGPTEAAIDVTSWTCERQSSYHLVPIGRPIANIRIYILDQNLRPVAVGVPGELHIGGVGLARGYLRRPDLTAGRFIPDPFATDPGGRLYKTGDMARYLPGGTIEFLGRIDHQVKLRGFRIEPGEIEAVLANRPEVRECVVAVREDTSGNKQLVAYVVPHVTSLDQAEQSPGVHLSAEQVSYWQQVFQLVPHLRNYLKEWLPDYMIPASFVLLETLPLTPNGKVNRRALPDPGAIIPEMEGDFVAPRTPVEEALVEVWSNVLGLEKVGVHNNYFELGGDSIRSILISLRAGEAGLRFTPRHLFQFQTIAELATVVEAIALPAGKEDREPSKSIVAAELTFSRAEIVQIDRQRLGHSLGIDAEEIEDVYPLAPMPQNMLFQRLHLPNSELYWLCGMTSTKGAQINLPAFEQAWQNVVDQQPTLRTVFVWDGLEVPLQIVLKHALMNIEYYDWRSLSPREQEKQREEFARALRLRGNQLAHAPHIHIAMVQVGDGDYHMFLGFNYMLQDGWSLTLRSRDFTAFYEAACQGQQLHLEPSRPYRDYIAWLQQQNFTQAESFWQKTLKDFTPSMPLAGQISGKETRAGDSYVKEILAFSQPETEELQALARKQQLTLATILNGMWALIVSQNSGRQDVVFGHLCSGRPPSLTGSEYIVGTFNTILPLRVQVPPEAQVTAWLRLLQKQTAELREYEYCSILKIKEWIGFPAEALMFESYVVFENFPIYTYDAVGARAIQDFGAVSSDPRHSFVPTEYPFRIEFWHFQQFTMMVSGYERFCTRSMALRLLEQLRALLANIVANPGQRLGELMRQVETQ